MLLHEELMNQTAKLAIIGLGYIGLPLAVAFSKKISVIGFDQDKRKIAAYQSGYDVTQQVGDFEVKNSKIHFTSSAVDLDQAKCFIIAVPTPVCSDLTPDLTFLKNACQLVGPHLSQGAIVIFESTVYPGVTEDFCAPILEQFSGLTIGENFKIGYSPERINPSDQVHRLEKVIKVVSGMDEETLNEIAQIYEMIIEAGIFRAESIKVAEAAKVIENCQRDINVAFMNEVAKILHLLELDTQSVLQTARTKWNFLPFTPGLVGGHCIGVDPYYLTYCAEKLGYKSQIISAGRQLNDQMGKYVVDNIIKSLIKENFNISNVKVAVLGLTFKENCADIRNSKVMDIIEELKSFSINPIVIDPIADRQMTQEQYGICLSDMEQLSSVDVVIFAVAHRFFKEYTWEWDKIFRKDVPTRRMIIDIKGMFNQKDFPSEKYCYWSL